MECKGHSGFSTVSGSEEIVLQCMGGGREESLH